jgi:hypothetical protein
MKRASEMYGATANIPTYVQWQSQGKKRKRKMKRKRKGKDRREGGTERICEVIMTRNLPNLILININL